MALNGSGLQFPQILLYREEYRSTTGSSPIISRCSSLVLEYQGLFLIHLLLHRHTRINVVAGYVPPVG
jgi:hypothetical protein